MDNIDKIIINISNKLEYLNPDINWEFFEDKFDFNQDDLCYNRFNHYICDSEGIINNAFNINPEKCIKMLEYICFKYDIDFDFTSIKEEINLENKEVSFDFSERDLQDLRVFISYSYKNLEDAKRINDIFKNANINCFMASEDIQVGEKWNESIFEAIVKSDIFILMVSKSYKKSAWCNQEASIAYLKKEFNESFVIPLLLDNTNPYGIFYDIQGISSNEINSIEDFAKILDSNSISLENAIKASDDYKLNEIDKIIEDLKLSNSFSKSNKLFGKFKHNDVKLYQFKKVIEYGLSNSQVMYCWEFKKFIKRYYKKYKEELDEEEINLINELFM